MCIWKPFYTTRSHAEMHNDQNSEDFSAPLFAARLFFGASEFFFFFFLTVPNQVEQARLPFLGLKLQLSAARFLNNWIYDSMIKISIKYIFMAHISKYIDLCVWILLHACIWWQKIEVNTLTNLLSIQGKKTKKQGCAGFSSSSVSYVYLK